MRISGVTYAVRRTNKKIVVFKVFIVLFLLVFLSSMGFCFYVGWSLTHPPKKINTFDMAKLSVPNYKDATFTDIKEKITLKGWYFRAATSEKTVILAHGYKSNRFQFDEKTIDMVNSFINNGYNILLFDFRASGTSGGRTSTVGQKEQDDLLGAIKYVKKVGSKRIVLLGVSMGASTSIITASGSKDVDAVIADSPFSDLESYLNENLPTWSHLPSIFNQPILLATRLFSGSDTSKVNPLKALKDLSPRPLLLIHSANDPRIPVSNSRELYTSYSKLVGDNVELWETEVAKHAANYTTYPAEYMAKIFEFLGKAKI